ncbi:MAG: carboxymuconolactone decarboxylase family protein [Kiloniellaceae bacterium]|jgi:AhpD family alkylhydroperoxidase|nr:carboxymuconolactone decarboxylase family protein [Kiloniellaceae bacterium]
MLQTNAFDYRQQIPEIMKALVAAETTIAAGDLDPMLRHLVKLRASQINGCAFCVKMHLAEARKDGETNDRLDRVIVWQHVDDFSEREKAALAWTEALTFLDHGADHSAVKQRLAQFFSDPQIAALTACIAMINLWNRLMVASH